MLSHDVIKIIYLTNAKANGWKVIYKNDSTFYIIKEKNISKSYNFDNEMDLLKKKPLNLISILNKIKH